MKKIVALSVALLGCITLAMGQTKWYDVKSGILTQRSGDGTSKIETTIWFDNYGEKQVTLHVTTVPEIGSYIMHIIYIGNKQYSVNDYGQVSPESVRPSLNFLNIDDKMLKEFKIKETGKETVMGKECTVYTYSVKQLIGSAKVTAWVWKGVQIKTVMKQGSREVVTEPVEFKVNAAIPASTFKVETYTK